MSERSEFGRRATPGEERRAPARRSRDGSRPAKALLVPFGPSKGTRARSGRKLLILILILKLLLVSKRSKCNSFRAVARVTFVLAKVTKTAFAGREPDWLRQSGPLRFSVGGARGPNSLRSDMGRSPAPPPCDARLALRLEQQRQRQQQQQQQRQQQRQRQ